MQRDRSVAMINTRLGVPVYNVFWWEAWIGMTRVLVFCVFDDMNLFF